jgi:hypothetical protein
LKKFSIEIEHALDQPLSGEMTLRHWLTDTAESALDVVNDEGEIVITIEDDLFVMTFKPVEG